MLAHTDGTTYVVGHLDDAIAELQRDVSLERLVTARGVKLRTREYRPAQPQPLTEPQRQRRVVRALHTLRELGFEASLTPVTAEPLATPT